jgi:hypothetical protein
MNFYQLIINKFNTIQTDVSVNSNPLEKQVVIHSPFQISQIQQFKLPIEYLEPTRRFHLSNVVSSDLELIKQSTDGSIRPSMYEYLFKPTHSFGQLLIPNWGKYYTTDIQFLKDTQYVIQNVHALNASCSQSSPLDCNRMFEIWDTIKQDKSFSDRYGYLDWDMLKPFNRSPQFLLILSFINVLSPAISLILPFILMIVPFVLLKIQRVPISFETYLDVLKNIAKHHFLGKTLLNMQSFSWDKLVYLFITIGLYCVQIYQNANSCIRYYRNISKITNIVLDMRCFTERSIANMENFLLIANQCPSYSDFCQTIQLQCNRLKHLQSELKYISPYTHSISSFMKNGEVLKHFYQLYENLEYEECIRFSMGFEGYINNLSGIYMNVNSGNVHFAKFDTTNECEIKKQFYPPLINETNTKNNCSLKENIIISAPNKAGKTTVLKTTTLNIIFSQQIGCGFYSDATINPFTHIHSYLNIPDTSERDSLFQAESRRCKDIIDIINENNDTTKYRHFCIFDELYSGTNPIEATQAGKAFLTYLCKYPNVKYMLTTHYVKICKHFKKSNSVCNYKMEVNVMPDRSFEYTYKMKKGISQLKGGIRVLRDMNYPEEILAELS